MKTIFFSVNFWLFSYIGFSQDTLTVKDLIVPNSPGFALLDISPTSIDKPGNTKAFGISLINNFASGTIPKNFALEATPFWFFKFKNESVYKYLSLKDGEQNNTASGILRKLSISMSSIYNDSAKNLLAKTAYISFGVKTNLLTFWGKKSNESLNQLIDKQYNALKSIAKKLNGSEPPKQIADFIEAQTKAKKDTIGLNAEIKSEIDKVKPLFQVDIAWATSNSFRDNKYSNRTFNRSAFWLNASLNSKLKDNGYFNFYGNIRFIKDNLLRDSLNYRFEKVNALDLGLKVEFEKDKFSLAVEFLKRNYAKNNSLNSNRTVGIVQYKIDNNLSIFGTFGKNFGDINNLFSLLGINWGFGKSQIPLPSN